MCFLSGRRDHRTVEPYERKQLLERVNRDGSTVGVDIPNQLEIRGETINLRSFILDVKRSDRLTDEMSERVEETKRKLRRERVERENELETADIDRNRGEELVEEIIGIERALIALERIDPVDLEAEDERRKRADNERWMNFLKQALGHDDDTKRRHR